MKLTIIRGVTPSQQETLDHYLAWMRAWSAAPATLKVRGIVARVLLVRYGDPETITTDQLTEWLASPSFSAATRAVYCSHANTFFGWLLETDRIARNPMSPIRRPRQPKGKPRPLSADEVSRALDAATPEVRAWGLLGMYAGLRAHEVAKIRGEDVNAHELVVRGKGGKLALLPTHPTVWALAQEYPRIGFWFPSTRTASGHVPSGRVSSEVTRLLSGLGVTGSHHRFRHTYGTNLLRSGANIRVVQELLRHNSLATTEVYTFVADDERRDAISRLIA